MAVNLGTKKTKSATKRTKAPFKTGNAINGTQSKKVRGGAPAPGQRRGGSRMDNC